MTARFFGHPALRAALAEAIDHLLVNHSAREVGRWIGRKGDTVTERGSDVDSWPLSELLVLAAQSSEVNAALRSYVLGDAPAKGEAVAAIGALLMEIGQASSMTTTAAAALADGKITPAEAANLAGKISDLRRHEEATLLPALRAIAGVSL